MEIKAFHELVELGAESGAVDWSMDMSVLLAMALFEAADWSMDMSVLLAMALFELARFEEARKVLNGWAKTAGAYDGDEVMYFKGGLALIAGHEEEAFSYFEAAALGKKHLIWPHQNLATKYSGEYVPNEVDAAAGRAGILYDGYNYAGQRVIEVGAGHLGAAMFAGALRAQEELRTRLPVPSPALQELLVKLEISLPELRIVPAEWFTQISHQPGLLDVLFRMRQLGWWSGRAILLPNPNSDLVTNDIMLSLFANEGAILLPGVDIDNDVAAELLSLKRYCALSFNAFLMPDGGSVPWQDASALLMQQWEKEKRGVPLREAFDVRIGGEKPIEDMIEGIKQQWGMQPGDWYVTLHMRDASRYGETVGSGQSHRNAELDSYLAAIEYVTSCGGWVIKLGNANSPKLPNMKRVVDYARSGFKSEMMDLWLIRHCRFFIGTTSGLANVAISFGTPCALVNCIITDAQPWHSAVRFTLKRIVTEHGRELSQWDVTSTPWRWRMFSAETMLHHGAVAMNNSSDEILETVKEVADLAVGGEYSTDILKSSELIDKWKANLAIRHFYGAALPSLHYIKKHEARFLCHSADRPIEAWP